MPKIRIIPIVLTNGTTVVKGKNFDNWRTVGDAKAVANLYSRRNIDELMFLDVHARKDGKKISMDLVKKFSEILNIPFSVGGGINTLSEASEYFRNGAEKVVLGTSASQDTSLITSIALKYGSQAITVSIDIESCENRRIVTNSGRKITNLNLQKYVQDITSAGAGELLLQNVELEGEMKGYDLDLISSVRMMTSLPIIASSGCGSATHAKMAIESGANAVAVGSLFHFTEITPSSLALDLKSMGFDLRRA
jgi:cyclase